MNCEVIKLIDCVAMLLKGGISTTRPGVSIKVDSVIALIPARSMEVRGGPKAR